MREFKPQGADEIVSFERETGLDAMTMTPLADAVTMRQNNRVAFDSFYGDGLE